MFWAYKLVIPYLIARDYLTWFWSDKFWCSLEWRIHIDWFVRFQSRCHGYRESGNNKKVEGVSNILDLSPPS